MPILGLSRGLDAPVDILKNLGPTNAARFEKLGIRTVRDLLLALPFGWEEYTPAPIAALQPGKQASVVGTVLSIKSVLTRVRRMKLTEATIQDDAGAEMRVVWFNNPYVLKNLHRGNRVALAGMVKGSRYGERPEMQSPHYERLEADVEAQPKRVGAMMPKYHLVDGLTSRKIAGWVEEVLPLADKLEDVLPAEVRERHHLLGVAEAVRQGHKPESEAAYQQASRRMAFVELLELQAAFAMMRANVAAEPAIPIPYKQEVIDAFKAGLGFELTRAQKKATWEAFQDMQQAVPMNRLLNGDVGSGKTAVAAATPPRVSGTADRSTRPRAAPRRREPTGQLAAPPAARRSPTAR